MRRGRRLQIARNEVFCGVLTEDYLRRQGPFDVVILADILEHLAEPAALLRLVARELNPGGMVLISVPNVARWSVRWHLMRGRFDYTETGIMDVTHLSWFTLVPFANFWIVKDMRYLPTAPRPAHGYLNTPESPGKCYRPASVGVSLSFSQRAAETIRMPAPVEGTKENSRESEQWSKRV